MESFFFSKPIFSQRFTEFIPKINAIRALQLCDIKPNITYGKKQQSMLEDKCNEALEWSKKELHKLTQELKQGLINLKQEILDDDLDFESGVKEMRVKAMIKQKKYGEELVMFS